MKAKLFLGGVAAALALSAAGAAGAAPTSCFFVTQWQGWSSPNPTTLYLRIIPHDVYRVDLSGGGSTMLNAPGMHLFSQVRGGGSICTALDLDLAVADMHGFKEPLIAKTLTKLTPDEAAQIPAKFRPN
jgi:hypothetical protein